MLLQGKIRGRCKRNYGKEAYELKQKYPDLKWAIISERLGLTNARARALNYEKNIKKQ